MNRNLKRCGGYYEVIVLACCCPPPTPRYRFRFFAQFLVSARFSCFLGLELSLAAVLLARLKILLWPNEK